MRTRLQWLRMTRGVPVTQRLLGSAQEATQYLMVGELTPTPDKLLISLWAAWESLHKAYLASGEQCGDILRVWNKTIQA